MTKKSSATARIDGRSVTQEGQSELRRRAIEFWKQGLRPAEIARGLGMTRQWVSKILNRAKSDGPEAAIKGKKRGPRRRPLLLGRFSRRSRRSTFPT